MSSCSYPRKLFLKGISSTLPEVEEGVFMSNTKQKSLFGSRKEARFDIGTQSEISTQTYNLIMAACVAWGLILNTIMCFNTGVLSYGLQLIAYGGLLKYLLIFVGLPIVGCLMSIISHNPAISFIGYNLIVFPLGINISVLVYIYGITSGAGVVAQAALITAGVTIAMLVGGVMFENFFLSIGRMLFFSLIGLIVAEVILLIAGVHQEVTAWIGAIIFSLYIGFDFARSQKYPKTVDNAVDCAVDIYLDIINLFIRILRILGKRN
jgi:FtsH-binding integral membrane protein